jgi:gas vesicle protein
MADGDEFGAFLIGFIIGGLTGAAIALIMAPQTGEETRAVLKDRAIELRDKAQETAQTVQEQVGSQADMVRSKASDLANKAKTSADDLRQRGQVMVEQQRSRLQNLGGSSQTDMPPEEM